MSGSSACSSTIYTSGLYEASPVSSIMKKSFLALFVISCLVVRCVFTQSCSLDPDGKATKVDVLILGAGITGITAARTLEVNGISNFLVLEAGDRIGGRIREYDGTNLELGANWISGLDLRDPKHHPIWREWVECDEDGPDGSATPSNFTRVYNASGNPYNIRDKNGTYQKRKEIFQAAFKEAAELEKVLTHDISVRQGLTKGGWEPRSALDNFTEWARIDFDSAIRPENISLLTYFPLNTYTEFLGPEMDAKAVDYLVADKKGFSFVVDCLARNFKNNRVHLNSFITKIQTADDCICAAVQENQLYCADYGIVTFSIGALQAAIRGDERAAQFEPPLPQWKQDAINSVIPVYYGKVHLVFNVSFWEETDKDQQILGYVSDQRGYYAYYIVDKHSPNTITVDVAEDLAFKVATQSEEVTVSEVMTILRKIFGNDIPEPHTAIVSKWSTDPLFLCAYTDFAPGVPQDLFDVLLRPINDRLYFAGEGLNDTDYGFTHSGYGSGANVAKEISNLKSL